MSRTRKGWESIKRAFLLSFALNAPCGDRAMDIDLVRKLINEN